MTTTAGKPTPPTQDKGQVVPPLVNPWLALALEIEAWRRENEARKESARTGTKPTG